MIFDKIEYRACYFRATNPQFHQEATAMSKQKRRGKEDPTPPQSPHVWIWKSFGVELFLFPHEAREIVRHLPHKRREKEKQKNKKEK
ncbi:hypothetical protein NPIL_115541 [Nephila pilipes]|uniref:Uncharacterized protein n=1 Tax=Nephila pilipes TaxID=299642 RepID=A0A8X6QKI2_NEPPI|nr:hypothetical protein NPIL_115541 [Nephila pilipes]